MSRPLTFRRPARAILFCLALVALGMGLGTNHRAGAEQQEQEQASLEAEADKRPETNAPEANASEADAPPISFRRQVAPILAQRCLECHDEGSAEGGYRLDSFERLMRAGDSGETPVVPGDGGASELFQRVVTEDESIRMPEGGPPLPDEEIEVLRAWIAHHAPFDGDDPQMPLPALLPPEEYPPPPDRYPYPLPVAAVAVAPGGQQLIVGGYHELTVWDSASGTLVRRIPNLPRRITALAWSPGARMLAVAGGDPGRRGEVRLVTWPEGEVVRGVAPSSEIALAVQFLPDGQRLAVAGADHRVQLIDLADGEPRWTFTGHSDWVVALALDGSGERLGTASRDGTTKVLAADSGAVIRSYRDHGQPVASVALAADGQTAWSGDVTGRLHRWNVEEGKNLKKHSAGRLVQSIQRHGDEYLVLSVDRGLARYSDAVEDKPVGSWRKPSGDAQFLSLALAPRPEQAEGDEEEAASEEGRDRAVLGTRQGMLYRAPLPEGEIEPVGTTQVSGPPEPGEELSAR